VKFENSFVVEAAPATVWKTMMDFERVAPCMPGAEVTEKTSDEAFKVQIRVKVGPMSMTYRGQTEIADRDDTAMTASMRVKARESRGQGTANATVQIKLAAEDGGTRASMDTDLKLSGRAAAMGISLFAVMLVSLTLYRMIVTRGSYATITGKAFRPRPMDMGRLTWLLLGVCILYAVVAVGLPLIVLVLTSFQRTSPRWSMPVSRSRSSSRAPAGSHPSTPTMLAYEPRPIMLAAGLAAEPARWSFSSAI